MAKLNVYFSFVVLMTACTSAVAVAALSTAGQSDLSETCVAPSDNQIKGKGEMATEAAADSAPAPKPLGNSEAGGAVTESPPPPRPDAPKSNH